MFIKRDGEFFDDDPTVDVVELPGCLEDADIGRRYVVEIWSDTPGKDGAEYRTQEVFDVYPTDEQLLWCFAKYGDGVVRIKEECYLIYPKYSLAIGRNGIEK